MKVLMDACADRNIVFSSLSDMQSDSQKVYGLACRRLLEFILISDRAMAVFMRLLVRRTSTPALLRNLIGTAPPVSEERMNHFGNVSFELIVAEAHIAEQILAAGSTESTAPQTVADRAGSIIRLLLHEPNAEFKHRVHVECARREEVFALQKAARAAADERASRLLRDWTEVRKLKSRERVLAQVPAYSESAFVKVMKKEGIDSNWIGETVKILRSLTDTQRALLMKYDRAYDVMRLSAKSGAFHLYVAMVIGQPQSQEQFAKLVDYFEGSDVWELMPALDDLVQACGLDGGRGSGKLLGCRLLAEFALSSDLAMAVVVRIIIRFDISRLFGGIELYVSPARSAELDSERLDDLVAEVHLSAASATGNNLERAIAITRAVLADRSAEATALVAGLVEARTAQMVADDAARRQKETAARLEQDRARAVARQLAENEMRARADKAESDMSPDAHKQMDWLDPDRRFRQSATTDEEHRFVLAFAEALPSRLLCL